MDNGFSLSIFETINEDPADLARKFMNSLRYALRRVGEEHLKERMPKHFTIAGGREYGYAPRTKKYMLSKSSRKQHQDPLRWSGDLKRAVLEGTRVRTRITDTEAKSQLSNTGLPDYVRFNPQLSKELKAVSAREHEKMTKDIQQWVSFRMKGKRNRGAKRPVK